jgi:hypothetical protein
MKKDKKLRAKIQALENELNKKSKVKKSIEVQKSKITESLNSVDNQKSIIRQTKIDIIKSVIFITVSFIGVYVLSTYIF